MHQKKFPLRTLTTLGIAGIAVAGLLARTVNGILSFVSNLLPSLTPKEGVGPVPKTFRRRGLFRTASIVGIGLLASPFPVQSNDEEDADQAPEVSCIWVENLGSSGFTVEFEVSDNSHSSNSFRLCQEGFISHVDRQPAPRATLVSRSVKWLSIPGFDGGPPLPYPGYLHSVGFIVKGEYPRHVSWEGISYVAYSQVSISLYVVLNSNGSLHSMHAWASDSDGDGYEVPLYYSPGGSENFRTFED